MNATPESAGPAAPAAIVSVNSRGATGTGRAAKVAFVAAVLGVFAVGALLAVNKWRAASKPAQAATATDEAKENKPAAVGAKRTFDSLTSNWADSAPGAASAASHRGLPPLPATQTANGPATPALPAVPGLDEARPIPLASDGAAVPNTAARPRPATGTQQWSAYGGDMLLSNSVPNTARQGTEPDPSAPPQQRALGLLESLMNQQLAGRPTQATGSAAAPAVETSTGTRTGGPLSTVLSPSGTKSAAATQLQNQELVIPKGRSIECALSMRLISDVAGMATCVVTQHVYSADGKVVLLERGSEAVGEYSALMAQGQQRLFVLWTRVRTPAGVLIELNSPAADGLGSSGLSGFVDNHWWERIGAAFMLSLVQDAVAYKVAEATPANGTTTNTTGQNTQQTGQRIAETVLSNSINIKPTLYRNQGDRGTIFVARDLDFGSVYALRAR